MNEKTDQPEPAGGSWFLPIKHFLLPGGRWIWVSIWLISALVIALNVWVGRQYFAQNKSLEYFESKAFEALLASLLIPLLMSSISRAFKIDEKLEADKRQLEHERKEKQYLAVKQTNTMWSELYNLSTEVAYFKVAQDKVPVRELRKKLERFANSAEEVVSLWYRNFPGIPPKDADMFLPGINLLLLSASTVADAIENGDAEAEGMQNGLLIIQDGVRHALHHNMMLIFTLTMEGKKVEVEERLVELRKCGKYFQALTKNEGPNLPPGALTKTFNEKRKKLQAAYEQYLKQKAEQPAAPWQNPFEDSPELNEYSATIFAISLEQLGLARKRLFSNTQIKNLAAEMFYQNDGINIRS